MGYRTCPECEGTGKEHQFSGVPCRECNGEGHIKESDRPYSDYDDACPGCGYDYRYCECESEE